MLGSIGDKMISDLKKSKDKVEALLNQYPVVRDSDKLLWLAYLVKFHDLKNELGEVAYRKFERILLDKNTVTMESIRRVRQKFQEQGKYVGTKREEKLAEAEEVKTYITSRRY